MERLGDDMSGRVLGQYMEGTFEGGQGGESSNS